MLTLCTKDAIFGLRELFDTYPSLIPQLLTPLVAGTVRLMSDEVGAGLMFPGECMR